jgi:uncharacterized small protein (DUF1192 family)
VNASQQQIVFSLQQVGIRDRYPDLESARLAIVQFPVEEEGRGIQFNFQNDTELLSYDEIDARIRVVYETWRRVCAERVHDGRKTGTNPFGF